MGARKKLAIIDGKSVFYRGYYAMPNLSTGQGVPTGGVYGFTSMALELLKKLKPDYVCVAWDKPKTNIRKRIEMYPQYKAGRKPAPPDFYTQIPILHEVLEALGWPLYELDDYEADDIMGTLALQAKKMNLETQLITSDLDALQLINSHVKVYALKRGFSNIEEFHPESFEAKYGLVPEQFLDFKALRGDASDNIPGVPGIGEKTAIALLQEYETLDGIYKNLERIKDSTRKKLETGRDSAYLSKKIGAIWCDAPIKLNLNEVDGSRIDVQRLQELLQKLEFRSLLRNLPAGMQASVPMTSVINGESLSLPRHRVIATDEELDTIKFPKTGNLFIFTRSAGKHGANPQALILGTEKLSCALDLDKLSPAKLKATLTQVLNGRRVIGYDIKNSIKILKKLELDPPLVAHDILVGAFLINPLVRVQTLTELAVSGINYDGADFDDLPTEDLISRGAEVVAVMNRLHHGQKLALEQMPKIEKLAQEIEWPVIPVLADMEIFGIKLDQAYMKKLDKEFTKTITGLEARIYKAAGQEFNIGSPAQLSDVLFDKLQLPIVGIKRTQASYSTAASELAKLRAVHPIIDLISEYREVAKLKNTYVDALPKQVDERGRVHTTFNLTIAQTGRLSSTDPNLQNIPVRTELGKEIRRAFIADPGNVLVSADYSQFELRLAAALSGDQGMIDAFNSDSDIHIETAALVYGIKSKDVTKQQRYSAKAVNFGIMYGQGPHGLAQSTGMPFGEAREFITKYFQIRPKLKEYIETLRKQASEQGYVETILGRRRPTPDVHSSNFVVREAAYRAAINHPMQGSAADLMKLAMIKISQKLPNDTRMLLQIHDSLIVEAPKHSAEKTGKMIKETMESIYKLPVKLKADISIGKNWGKL